MKKWEGETMKKPIKQIKPNPHRNFDIYPIGEPQVKLLMESIDEVGMFLGLPARKVGDFYEIACGHHRLEALERIGATHVDLAVNDYSDEEMLKIMIRENSTQRGNENFGAVLDSVGAVLIQIVRDVYKDMEKNPDPEKTGNLNSGRGIGRETILSKEPSLSEGNIKAALFSFRNTGVYLQLLKKGGLPEEFWHWYEKPIITSIEAVAMFPKPAHAATWVKRVDSKRFQQKIGISQHVNIVSTLVNNDHPLSTRFIESTITRLKDTNLGSQSPTETPEKELVEKAYDVIKAIKSLKNKIEKFKIEKGEQECFVKSIPTIIEDLQQQLVWFNDISHEEIINI